MSTIVDAVYRDGVFRPATPPDLPDGTAVRLSVVPALPAKPHLTGAEGYALIQKMIARSHKPGPPENTSENVDAILYGQSGDPGDVR